ncbi:low molecular weight protein-tyrosine-phosphatase [Arcanobacterium pinnipediorum]|uniref:protein-tyrosine-phosphatase n=1 Tax=Arcanobacterium pinnipediorum TaxID=1503041 RepID=A0ABY5AI12_9ACTO|nr:low molecular weight protein-tyrosine-phosphatase [Arcanobacterium pinnipediorum]USR79500.1 low molecular weight phosphotyrosine protein phosphatase [Arcanobacterium pinnipediorum]
MKILVVCTGNICRSPMGAIVLQSQLDEAGIEAHVTSAGVSSEESGHPIDSRAARVLRERGYRLPRDHQAHQASDVELAHADLILAMTTGHARSLRRMMLSAGLGEEHISRIHLWREFDGTVAPSPTGVFGPGGALEGKEKVKAGRGSDFYTSNGELDVLDPWYGDESGFYDTLAMVETGARGIVQFVANAHVQ